MKDANLKAALTAFAAHAPRFITESENAVYEVQTANGKAALRLHRPGYQSEAAIRSELWWVQALANAGVSVPKPIPARDGALIATLPDDRLASMVEWVPGAPYGVYGEPLAGTGPEQEALFGRIGQAIAQLHNVTDTLTLPPGFQRHAWDSDGFLGDTPFWGRFWENPSLTDDEVTLVQRARAVARDRLRVFRENGADYGLIHADVLRSNTYVDGDRVTLIDFDDCGFGFRIYDLATLMSQNEGLDNTPALQAAAIEGYRRDRPLSDEAVALLPMFLMLRRFASMGWIVPRREHGSDWVRIYADRAVKAARRFL
ncbi:MAG TPA: homoserine kinase [Aliiroseovarius sp.]|nr:homoserine kinase [Aliiroseovarius sp.]